MYLYIYMISYLQIWIKQCPCNKIWETRTYPQVLPL